MYFVALSPSKWEAILLDSLYCKAQCISFRIKGFAQSSFQDVDLILQRILRKLLIVPVFRSFCGIKIRFLKKMPSGKRENACKSETCILCSLQMSLYTCYKFIYEGKSRKKLQ